MSITSIATLTKEIELTPRVVATEYKIVEINENIQNREVRVSVELGPFITEQGPGGNDRTRGSGRRNIVVWQGDAYDAVRDTWTNTDLIAVVSAALQA